MNRLCDKIFYFSVLIIVTNALITIITGLLVHLLVPTIEYRILIMFLIMIVSSVLLFTVSCIFTRRCLKSTVREDNSIK